MAQEEVLTHAEPDAGGEGLPPDDVSRETPEPDHAAEAHKVGWREKDEFVAKGGRESDWVPAEQFLKTRAELSSARAKENKRLERMLSARDAEIDAVKRENAEIKAALAEQAKSRGEITEQALMSQRRAAAENQDWTEFDRLDSELAKVRQRPPPAPAPAGVALDPRIKATLDDFAEEFPVYQRPEMQRLLALGVKAVREADPTMSVREALNEGHEWARRTYSDRYTTTNGATKRPPMAETGGTPARAGADTKQWSDLKPEARGALDALIKDSSTYSKMKPEGIAAARARMLKDASPDMFKGGR